MAKPTQAERDEVQGLVRWLYEKSGCTSWATFANRAGVLPSSMSDWSRGENAPSSYNLVKMMRAAGIIDDGISESAGEVPDFQSMSIGRHLESLEGKVEAQGKSTTLALKALTAGIRKLERRLDAGAPPATRKAEEG